MNILGISAYYHDSAACLIIDGRIVAAAQEERFTRKKHDSSFPAKAVEYCLREGGIKGTDLDYVAFYDKPFIKFERIMETYLTFAPYGISSFIKAVPLWIKQKLWIKESIREELGFTGKVIFPSHHESHAASAFYASPFQSAAMITADGVGEWATASYGVGSGHDMKLLAEIHFPHSLGLLYSAFTYYCGFKVNSGEYKLMGLAPYGQPKYADLIRKELIDIKDDGSFRLNLKYFDYCAGLRMVTPAFEKLFGRPARKPETKLSQMDMDMARSIQEVTEDVMIKMARHVRKVTGEKYLCLAGGVALNCVANGRLLRENIFEDIWIQPAAGDAGGALGAALFTWHKVLGNARTADNRHDSMRGSYLGPEYRPDEIRAFLEAEGIPYTEVDEHEIPERAAELIASEKVVGWFQGRMEFGPRALGGRSILGDARSAKMQEIMNLKIKFRESFRPFAPSVLRDKVAEYFEMDADSPYMLMVATVRKEIRREMTDDEKKLFGLDLLNVKRSTLPAVTHVDYSARIQTVNGDGNGLYLKLLEAFDEKYQCPVIINTSFNVRGEPPVCTPQDAFRCFMRTDMDYLMLGPFLLEKTAQKPFEKDESWQKEFALD